MLMYYITLCLYITRKVLKIYYIVVCKTKIIFSLNFSAVVANASYVQMEKCTLHDLANTNKISIISQIILL